MWNSLAVGREDKTTIVPPRRAVKQRTFGAIAIAAISLALNPNSARMGWWRRLGALPRLPVFSGCNGSGRFRKDAAGFKSHADALSAGGLDPARRQRKNAAHQPNNAR
jgi:hypothetical protein